VAVWVSGSQKDRGAKTGFNALLERVARPRQNLVMFGLAVLAGYWKNKQERQSFYHIIIYSLLSYTS